MRSCSATKPENRTAPESETIIMALIANLKPKFWDHADVSQGSHKHLFNFRKIWKLTIFLTLAVTLIPLLVVATIDYRLSRNTMESEIVLRTARLVSNTRRTVSYFLAEHKAAIDFLILNESLEHLVSPGYLEKVLESLKKGFGGFADLGVVSDQGRHLAYIGPYELSDKNYKDTLWFRKVADKGVYISDVFMGFRNVPHMVVAVRHDLADGRFYVLRATLDTERFNNLLSGLEVGGDGDAFIINREGILQTPSRYNEKLLSKIELPVPDYSEKSQVVTIMHPRAVKDEVRMLSPSDPAHDWMSEVHVAEISSHGPLLVGYAYIPETQFILMIVKNKDRLMESWNYSQIQLMGFITMSVFTIFLVVLGGITYLVNQIYMADQRHLMAIHNAEYSNKMASLGRLSAGVAHEINNPLAIINEKAGLIKDIFTYREDYNKVSKLMELIEAVISSVDRCANITRRLLNFARNSDMMVKPIVLKEVITDVLGFMGKEAQYRCIDVSIDVADDANMIESDQGRLQEIFLNLITNAFAAVEDGGKIEITVRKKEQDRVAICISDNGYGISEENLDKIFEPFFSTRISVGGTGLGLSITYGLIQELGGRIRVESRVDEGTKFKITLPLQQKVQPESTGKICGGEKISIK